LFKTYLSLTKPGIIRGNAVTAAAGFFFASRGNIDIGLGLALLVGLSLVIASACVFNNYIDRGIDKKMARTKQRALVSGSVSGRNALIFASLLGILGAVVLGIYTNALTLGLALFGFFAYVVIYGIGKRATVHGTVIGSISGAVPPVAGYTAAAGSIDSAAIILFLILVFWQMPHFYAIAMYRSKDYAAAGIPVLPVARGLRKTQIQILLYVAAFTLTAYSLAFFGYAGYIYAATVSFLGLFWFVFGTLGFNSPDKNRWARKMFFLSLIIITVVSIMLSVDHLLG
jgi:protoheme IX farnesyltransferase